MKDRPLGPLSRRSVMAETDEDAAEVLAVFVDAVVKAFDVGLLQEAKHMFLELAATFAGDDFDQFDPLVDGIANDPVQRILDGPAFVVNVV